MPAPAVACTRQACCSVRFSMLTCLKQAYLELSLAQKHERDPVNEIALYYAKTERIDKIIGHLCGLGRILIAAGAFCYTVYTIDAYLKNGPEQISAVAAVVDALKLQFIIPSMAAGLAVGTSVKERRGKQRAIKKAGKYQGMVEQGEPNRTSSGLTEIGTTPKED